MVQLNFPLVFTRNIPGVPRKSFLRDVSTLRSCERLRLAESLVTGSAHPPPLSCNKEKRWSNYHSHLFSHAIAFLACLRNPFFATFARSVRANDCCWQNPWLPVRLIQHL